MKRIIILVLCALCLSGFEASAAAAREWDFTKGISEQTKANMQADPSNWESVVSGTTTYWRNSTKQDPSVEWTANGQVISELSGLLIDIGANQYNSLLLFDNKLRLTRANTIITFLNVTDGQKITIVGKSANNSATNRGIVSLSSELRFMPGESSSLTNDACIFLGGGGDFTFTWKVVTDNPNDGVDVQFQLSPQAGIDFKLFRIADKDYTYLVGTDPADWNGESCGAQYAPMANTMDGRYVNMAETYAANLPAAGEKLWQTVSGLPNGTYKVGLYANALYTDGRGFDSDLVDGATDVAWLKANDARTDIVATIGTQVVNAGAPISLQNVPFCMWDDWGADANKTGVASCAWTFNTGDLIYGDASVNNYADLSHYSRLVITTTQGTPRILFNRTETEGQWNEDESQSALIDNTRGGWSAKYFSQDGNTYTVDLEQMVKDQGFAHLHAIKAANYETVVVENILVEKKSGNGLYYLTTDVTDGTLRLSLGTDETGTNWHTVQIKSLEPLNQSSGADRLYIDDFSIKAGEQTTVNLNLTNSTPYSAIQCDVFFPEGIDIAVNSRGKLRVTMNEDRAEDHTATVAKASNGAYRFIISSMTSASFMKTSGAILSMTLQASGNYSGTGSTGRIESVILVKSNGEKHQAESSTFEVNGGGIDDGNLFIDDFSIKAGAMADVNLNLTSTTPYSAIQCDVFFPEGIDIAVNSRGKYRVTMNEYNEDTDEGRSIDHTATVAKASNGAYRFIISSMTSASFMKTSGAILSMKLQASDTYSESAATGRIESVILVKSNGEKYQAESTSFKVNGGGEEPDDHYYQYFDATTTLITTVDNLKDVAWVEGGTYASDKYGSISPYTGEEGEQIVQGGIMLKSGNANKAFETSVTGISCVWAFATGNSTVNDRDLVVTAYDAKGNLVSSVRGSTKSPQSVRVELNNLNPSQKYRIVFTGCEANGPTGADVVLHGVRFVKDYFAEKVFMYNRLKYHTTSASEVEVIGNNAPQKSLSIPSSIKYDGITYKVTAIASNAFAWCSSIGSVTVPNSVTTIGGDAFAHSSISLLYLSASVANIDSWILVDCPNLSSIIVDAGNPYWCSEDGVLFNKEKTMLYRYPPAKVNLFYEIPGTVDLLREGAFSGNDKLEYVSLSPAINASWWGAFEQCTGLKTIVCRGQKPLNGGEYDFLFPDEVYKNATVWVPKGCVANYRSHVCWKGFSKIKETPASIVVSVSHHYMTYGDKVPTSFNVTYGEGPIIGTPVTSTSATSTSDAGSYPITITEGSLHSDANIQLQNGMLTIEKYPVDVSVGNYTITQGDPLPTFNITYSSFANNQTESVLIKKATATCSAKSDSAPGEYAIKLSGAEATNYSFRYHDGTLTIVAADAIVVTAESYTINYGDALPSFKYNVTGGQLSGTPAISCSAGSRPDVGVYEIIVTKGSVSNYNVSFIKGTLTVKKAPLTVSAGNYVKYEDEDLPDIKITYDGWKYNQGPQNLDQVPTLQYEFNKWSPAGTYPIIVSGGQSKNYDLKYVDGQLVVKHIYRMILFSQGNGAIVYGNDKVETRKQFRVKEDEDVTVRLVPNDGYRLDMLSLNGDDVMDKVSNGSFHVGMLTDDIDIFASFAVETGSFIEGGIVFSITSAPQKTVTLEQSDYSGHLVVPAAISHNGQQWSVTGIASNAFNNCADLITVELPASLDQAAVGISLFTGCTGLAAITWNAGFPMTQQMLGVLTNPNLLFFAANGSYAPTGITNVVVNGTAQQIVLQDPEGDTKANFYSPRTFTAASITYSHVYTLTSGINGEVLGWETIALPFIVQKIEHRQKGILTMFSRYDAKNASQRPFWLYRYGENGFVPASQIDANRAFLICMPNNPEYDDEYNLAGEVSFSATNVQVLRTGYVNMQQRGNKKFMPVFCHTKKSSSIYAMNINDASRPGSAFVSNSRDLKPFEAYMTTDQVGARPVFEIDFEDANAIADALMPTASRYTVYSLSGQLLVKTDSQNEYQKALDLLPAGIYIVNGKKQQIKK